MRINKFILKCFLYILYIYIYYTEIKENGYVTLCGRAKFAVVLYFVFRETVYLFFNFSFKFEAQGFPYIT